MNAAQQQSMARKEADMLDGKTYKKGPTINDPFVYYDTHVLDAGTTKVTLFNNSTAKNLSQSNYPFQQLPVGQSFDIYGMKVSYESHALVVDATQQLFMDWIRQTVVQVQIVNKVPSYERNLAMLLGGQVHMATAPAVTVNSRNLTVWTGNTTVKFKNRIWIDRQTPWFVYIQREVANNAALTGDWVRVEMIGKLTQL